MLGVHPHRRERQEEALAQLSPDSTCVCFPGSDPFTVMKFICEDDYVCVCGPEDPKLLLSQEEVSVGG